MKEFEFFICVCDLILTVGRLSAFLIPWEYRVKGPAFSIWSSGSSPALISYELFAIRCQFSFLRLDHTCFVLHSIPTAWPTVGSMNAYWAMGGWRNEGMRLRFLICGLVILLPALPTFWGPQEDEWGENQSLEQCLFNRNRMQVTNVSQVCILNILAAPLPPPPKPSKIKPGQINLFYLTQYIKNTIILICDQYIQYQWDILYVFFSY